MAFILDYTDKERMVDYPASYWRIDSINIQATLGHADFVFLGYASREAAAAARSRKIAPIGAISFTIANDQFRTALAAEEAGQVSVRVAGYEVAKASEFFQGAESV